jgi:hypothetical protein
VTACTIPRNRPLAVVSVSHLWSYATFETQSMNVEVAPRAVYAVAATRLCAI